MGIRQTIEQKKSLVVCVMIGIMLCSAWVIAHQLRGNRQPVKTIYFTVDDGATWFPDSIEKLAPFEHDGKEAVIARLYRSNGKEFVGYLERLRPEAKKTVEECRKIMAEAQAQRDQNPDQKQDTSMGMNASMKLAGAMANGTEVKKPGESKWVLASSSEGIEKLIVKGPDGKNAELVVGY